MSEENKLAERFVGYEYHTVTVDRKMESIYTDGYENFGWSREEASSSFAISDIVNLKFKRDRKIRNKAELTRLQRQFDACVGEIIAMEKSQNAHGVIISVTIGIIGCAFLGGATFSYLSGMIPLMIVLAIPGFLAWILPYFCYRGILAKRGAKIAPLIEKKHDEIYDVCEKASHLLAGR